MAHEIVTAFEAHGLTLCNKLVEMLNDQPQHCTERRGCGLTQATRLLATYVNRERSPSDATDLSLLKAFPSQQVTTVARHCIDAGWPHGWRRLDLASAELINTLSDLPCAAELRALPGKLEQVAKSLVHEESQLLVKLFTAIVSIAQDGEPSLAFMPVKPEIGSCSQAEEFFLEIAHGKIRRGGHVNILTDENGKPLLIEKMRLGESHSAIFLQPIMLGGVCLPPGSLAALTHHNQPPEPPAKQKWQRLPLNRIAQARFLRLTTLAVSPNNRQRAFSSQFKRQVVGNMLSPASTTLDHLRQFADSRE